MKETELHFWLQEL